MLIFVPLNHKNQYSTRMKKHESEKKRLARATAFLNAANEMIRDGKKIDVRKLANQYHVDSNLFYRAAEGSVFAKAGTAARGRKYVSKKEKVSPYLTAKFMSAQRERHNLWLEKREKKNPEPEQKVIEYPIQAEAVSERPLLESFTTDDLIAGLKMKGYNLVLLGK